MNYKLDNKKVGILENVLLCGFAVNGILLIISVIIAIWYEPFPGTNAIITFIILTILFGWLGSVSLLDDDGELREEYRKED